MKQPIKITTKLMMLQLLTLFLILFVVISVNIYLRNENFIEIQKRYMSLVAQNIYSKNIEGIEDTKIKLLAMSADNQLKNYIQERQRDTLDGFLKEYSHVLPLITYVNKDGFEERKILYGEFSEKLYDFKDNPLYKKAQENSNRVVYSKVVWSEDLATYVIDFALQKELMLVVSVPIKDFLRYIKLQDKQLEYRIISSENKIEFSSQQDEVGNILEIDKKITHNAILRTTLQGEDSYLYTIPFLEGSSIVVSYKYADFMATPNANIKYILMIVLFIMFVIIAITYKFSLKITKSLYKLIKAVRSISKGDYTRRIEVECNDEIGLLADNFNSMVEQLQVSQLEIQEKNLKLLQVNQELKKNEETIKSINESLTVQIKEAVQRNLLKDKQLLHQSKLAQMGDMVSMIAHQWRQPLNAISATSTKLSLLATMNMLEDAKIEEDSVFIQNQCQKMSKTIDTFMNFVKPSSESKEFYFKDTIDAILDIMGKQLSNHNIEVITEYKDEKISLLGHEDLLEQVILNLLSNARDAFEDTKKDGKFIKIVVFSKDDTPVVTIEDNAGGIDISIREKIFNPYFTTKEQGKGTGIGLYMSMDIMKKSFGGNLLYVATENGSRFEIVCG